MKALPDTDRRSWTFQANMHDALPGPSDPLFRKCEHGTIRFLVWHRGYIYYFERILRWASGDLTLNLPYWDWSRSPAVPEPFRVPQSPGNPLYEERRVANDGRRLPAEIVVDPLRADLELTDFYSSEGTGFSGSLEAVPHGAVHTFVGGADGLMSRTETAANDPIFWLHHCNIDRIWDRWLNLKGGRANALTPDFLDAEFTYSDETGQTITHRASELVSSFRLGYRYDDVPNPAAIAVATTVSLMAPPSTAAAASPTAFAAAPAPPPVPIATSVVPGVAEVPRKKLGLKTETVRLRRLPVPVRAEAVPMMSPAGPGALPQAAATARRPHRVYLRVNGISYEAIPEFTYGVYINVPQGRTPTAASRGNLAGTLNFFAKGPHQGGGAHAHGGGEKTFDQVFDITNLVSRLRQFGQWNENVEPKIDIRPIAAAAPRNMGLVAAGQLDANVQQANVQYQSIEILEGN